MSHGDITKITSSANVQNVQKSNVPKVKAVDGDNVNKTEKHDQTNKSIGKDAQKTILWQNLSADDLKKVTQWLNESMRLFNFRLQFEIQQHPNHIVAKVLDKETGEVIREVPPESLANMLERMQNEMGLFVDKMI